jgi:hypothetical protein
MRKSYEQPNVTIKCFPAEDVIRTSTPGVGSFNPDWIGQIMTNTGNFGSSTAEE